MSELIRELEHEQLRAEPLPDFRSGDTVEVMIRVREGQRERLQSFRGVVIAKRNRGLNSAFTVRKISYGVGVERVFQSHSPTLASLKVLRPGRVRRGKLYYLRALSGRAGRIKERILHASAKKAPPKTEKSAPPSGEQA